jgi:uncharacterized membrane protein
MAEREQAHRHSLAEANLKGGLRIILVGQIEALLIGVAGIGAGFVLVLKDKAVGGLATVIISLATLAGVYIWNQYRQTRDGQRVSTSKTAPQEQSSTSK